MPLFTGWTRALVIGLLASLSQCTTPQYGEAPFTCVGDTRCPDNFRCVANVCISNADTVPLLITTTIDEAESAFSLHARPDNSLLLCWNELPSARSPGTYGAIVSTSGGITVPAVPLYSGDSQSAAVVTGVHGDCSVRGDTTLVGFSRQSGHDAFLFRLLAADPENHTASVIADMPPYGDATLLYMLSGEVAHESWFAYTIFPDAFFDRNRQVFLVRVTDSLQATGHFLPQLPEILVDVQILSTEIIPGTGGAWLNILLSDGGLNIAWLPEDHPEQTGLFLAPAITGAQSAFPLAAHGNEQAVAYRMSSTEWRLFWIAPSATSTDPRYGGSVVRPGPVFTLPPGVQRPGGLADGDNFWLAGSDSSSEVTLRRIPWGATDLPASPTVSLHKLSSVVARRLRLLRVGSHLMAAWTERIPGNGSAGTTEYTALYASPVNE